VNVGLLNGAGSQTTGSNPLGAVTSAVTGATGTTGQIVNLIGKHP
jgi:hypothetical protein